MFYQVGLFPVTNNLLDISNDIYMIVQGMIRSDRLKIPGSCVYCYLAADCWTNPVIVLVREKIDLTLNMLIYSTW